MTYAWNSSQKVNAKCEVSNVRNASFLILWSEKEEFFFPLGCGTIYLRFDDLQRLDNFPNLGRPRFDLQHRYISQTRETYPFPMCCVHNAILFPDSCLKIYVI